jgi:hypothetical protein
MKLDVRVTKARPFNDLVSVLIDFKQKGLTFGILKIGRSNLFEVWRKRLPDEKKKPLSNYSFNAFIGEHEYPYVDDFAAIWIGNHVAKGRAWLKEVAKCAPASS